LVTPGLEGSGAAAAIQADACGVNSTNSFIDGRLLLKRRRLGVQRQIVFAIRQRGAFNGLLASFTLKSQ
jgi:hypothetical protein